MIKVHRAYMDETGIQSHDPYLTIAGYVSTASEWDKFEYRWQWVLREYMGDCPEERQYFHALEFYGKNKEFSKWKPGKRRSFIDSLFGAINDFDLALFSSTVDSKLFFSFTEDERRYLTGGVHNGIRWKTHGAPTKPYFLPFQFCLIQAANFVPEGELLQPVMSRQDQYKMHALELYESMLNSYPPMECRPKLSDSVTFSNPKEVPALQAADLAVYWFGQLMKFAAKTGDRKFNKFPNKVEPLLLFKNADQLRNFRIFDFQGIMLALGAANRYIKTSFPTLDQGLPSLPMTERLKVLGSMRKVNFRPFLDQWKPSVREDHD